MGNFFLQKQALKGRLQNSCSKQLFGKLPGGLKIVLKKDSAESDTEGWYRAVDTKINVAQKLKEMTDIPRIKTELAKYS